MNGVDGISHTGYGQALDQIKQAGKAVGTEEIARTDGMDFGATLEANARKAINIAETAETNAVKAVNGDIDLPELVQSVANAETTLKTVVTVRDRLVQAYQEIIKMPV